MFNHLRVQKLRLQTLSAFTLRDWREIPIHDNGESLVEVPQDICYPYYTMHLSVGSDPRIFVRESVLDRLFIASEILAKAGYQLRVYDGWRSLERQEALFWRYLKEFTADRFNFARRFEGAEGTNDIRDRFGTLSADIRIVLFESNRTFVSWPSSGPRSPSPHVTGGAVNVWLYRHGEPCNLGVPFDWMKEESGTFYHLKRGRSPFSGSDRRVVKNRTRLILSMADAGFSCYGPQIWHFNYGNQMHALVSRDAAVYSYIEPTVN